MNENINNDDNKKKRYSVIKSYEKWCSVICMFLQRDSFFNEREYTSSVLSSFDELYSWIEVFPWFPFIEVEHRKNSTGEIDTVS